jgi:hypothetical protein
MYRASSEHGQRFTESVAEVRASSTKLIEDRHAASDLAGGRDLLALFFGYRDENGKGFDAAHNGDGADMTDIVMNFIIAGRDTTVRCAPLSSSQTSLATNLLQDETRLYGARFPTEIYARGCIGSHAQASRRVTNGIPLGCSPLLPVDTVNCVQTLKACTLSWTFFILAENPQVQEKLLAEIMEVCADPDEDPTYVNRGMMASAASVNRGMMASAVSV